MRHLRERCDPWAIDPVIVCDQNAHRPPFRHLEPNSALQVTLLHNPAAGDEDHGAAKLCALIERAHHQVTYQSTVEPGWLQVVRRPTDLIAVAGGDGTVGRVMRELANRPTALALLPLGSANNIARALEIADVPTADLISSWDDSTRHPYFLGRLSTTGGERAFVESAGGGLFATAIGRAEERGSEETDKVELGLRVLRELIDELPAQTWEVRLDGIDHSGDYLAVEAMVIGHTGPSLPLAPHAEPTDQLLEAVLITSDERTRLASYLTSRLHDEQPRPPALPTRRARQILLSAPADCDLRVDDELWHVPRDRSINVTTGQAAVQLLLPDRSAVRERSRAGVE
jgi:diacylglycerol kinase family enzyme